MQLYDLFVTGIQQGTKLDDVTFELVEADKDGNIVFVKYEGAWLIVDNGYLRWPTTVPPLRKARNTSRSASRSGWNLCGKMSSVHLAF